MLENIIYIVLLMALVLLAALFSGAETGLYQLSRLRLRLGIQKKRLSYILLGKMMDDNTGLLLSLLTSTSLVQYLITSIVTYVMLSLVQSPNKAEVFTTLITAPVLFILCDLIPKTIFFYQADVLMPRYAPLLFGTYKVLDVTRVIPMLKLVSGFFIRLTGSADPAKTIMTAVHRHHVAGIVQETQEEGLLSPIQAEIVNRIVTIPDVRIKTVMTPITSVRMVDKNSTRGMLLEVLKKTVHTRLPVYDKLTENIIGFINIYQVLGEGRDFTDLSEYIQPIRRLSLDTLVAEATTIMQRENHKIVLVTRPALQGEEKPAGIVTMKDLVEELLGELAEW